MVTTKKVQTEELCVKKSDGSNICLTGDQLQAMVNNQGLVTPPPSEPIPEPTPEPTPTSEPTPEPILEPAPEPDPELDPEPTPEP